MNWRVLTRREVCGHAQSTRKQQVLALEGLTANPGDHCFSA